MKTNKSVFCIANTRERADHIVSELKAAHFSQDAISALFADHDDSKVFAQEENTKAPEGAITGAGAGGLVGGTLGWIAGIGALAIPGVGPFIAAGPIMAALGGAALGATAGGIAGGLIGMGIPEYEAKRYEGRLNDGGILISVHADTDEEIEDAEDIFANAGGEDIHVASDVGQSV